MKILNPNNLKDAKNLIDSTVGGATKEGLLSKVGLDGAQQAIDNWNKLIDAVFSIGGFIKNCLTDPMFLINQLKGIAPDVILILLAILIILKFLGFETTNKYILLTLVIAFIIAII